MTEQVHDNKSEQRGGDCLTGSVFTLTETTKEKEQLLRIVNTELT